MRPELVVTRDAEALADSAAARFIAAGNAAVEARGGFLVVLSGGATPRRLYERLASEALASQVAWSRVHVLWGDERCVPPGHEESNYRMAREALLDRVPIPPAQVHRIRGEDEPAVAASLYEGTIRRLLGTAGSFDLVLLGLGEDGHTASLFPGSAALRERNRWVMAQYAPSASGWRVTMTPVVINAAAEVLFLVSGSRKAPALQRVLTGRPRPDVLPAQAIAPARGRVQWLVDVAAAAALEDA